MQAQKGEDLYQDLRKLQEANKRLKDNLRPHGLLFGLARFTCENNEQVLR